MSTRSSGSFDRFINLQITIVLVMQMAMCIFCASASQVWRNNNAADHAYLALTIPVNGVYRNDGAWWCVAALTHVQRVCNVHLHRFLNFLTFWILYSYLVPISLFVTMEIVKLLYGSRVF